MKRPRLRKEVRVILQSDPDREREERKAKASARNKPLHGSTSFGPASTGRRLSGEELQAAMRRLIK